MFHRVAVSAPNKSICQVFTIKRNLMCTDRTNHITIILACEQAPSWRQAQQKFGAKRRASGACTHLPKSQLPPTRRTACQLSTFNQSARAESQNPQQTKNDTREILVFACLFSRKNYLWLKSRDTKPRTITAKLRSSEGHVKE